MTQRNPMNERYQDEDRKGHSRKSAASAKPKTSAAGTITIQSTEKTAKQKKQERKQREREQAAKDRELAMKYSTPDSPEYKKWKKAWAIGLFSAILLVIASWFLREVQPEWISIVVLALAYIAIIFAFWVDLSKIRKVTRKWQEEQIEKEKKANKGKSKKQIAEERAQYEEALRKAKEEREANSLTGKLKKKRAEKKAAKEQEKAESASNSLEQSIKEEKEAKSDKKDSSDNKIEETK